MEAFLGLVAEKVMLALGSEALNAIGYVTKSQRLQLSEVNERMKRIRSEFEHMQTFISNVDLHKYSPSIQPWVKRAREIADSMEDVIDQYLYLSAQQSQAATLYCCRNPFDRCPILSSNPWSDIDNSLKRIEYDLAHLKEMKERYDTTKLDSREAGSSATPEVAPGRKPFNPASLDTAHENDMTLFAPQRNSLITWLTDSQRERRVIVVWGMGGLGKTTLVENVYNDEKIDKHFDYKAWLSVSKYDPNELLVQLLKELDENPEDGSSMIEMVRIVRYILKEERYLLVLDDVWTPDAFTYLNEIIPNDAPGSRVVITTRSKDIAETLASKDRNMELSKLDDNQAWRLFCEEAFRKEKNGDSPSELEIGWSIVDKCDGPAFRKGKTSDCPPELLEIGWSIVGKCDGLPLAIIAIARVMSLKRKTDDEWKRVLDKLSWEFDNNTNLKSVMHVLNLSFEDLPSYLKNCFLYCSFFPDDCIERKKLIKLWVAEGFIPDRGSQTREEVAENSFEELVRRSMLHVVEENLYREVRRCRIHRLVRDNTLSTARKEMFSMVLKESEPSQLGEDARRLSVHHCCTKQSILFKMDFSRIRSLFIFDCKSSTKELFNYVSSKARYMRVIDLENAKISKIPSALTGLFNLHYLGLRGTKVKRLPRSIGKLRNLQTLDVRNTKVEKLPKGINQLKNLRHLLNKVEDESRHGTMHSYRFVRSPHGVWNLRSLQELSMAVDEATVSRLGSLTGLRILKVSNVKQKHCGNLCISLSQMPSLFKLSIIAADTEVLPLRDIALAPLSKTLHKLRLNGRLAFAVAEPVLPAPQTTGLKLPFSKISHRSGGATPPRPPPREVRQQMGVFDSKDYILRGLCLGWSKLKDDPLPMISSLRNLMVLKLQDTSDTVELRFGEGWFPNLTVLKLLRFKHLNKIIVEKEALKSLETWAMIGLSKLMLLPKGIESLTALSLLQVSECNPFFLYEIQGDHKHSVDHIPRIEHKYQVDGKWISESLTRSSAAAPPQPAPSQPRGEEIQPPTVPGNRAPSPSLRKTKSYSELPTSGSSLQDPDRWNSVPFPKPNSQAPIAEPNPGKPNLDSSIQEPKFPSQNPSQQADPHEQTLLKAMQSLSLDSSDVELYLT